MYLEPTSNINLFKFKHAYTDKWNMSVEWARLKVQLYSNLKQNLVYNKHSLINEDKYRNKLN